jgi:hypothetical protein
MGSGNPESADAVIARATNFLLQTNFQTKIKINLTI